MSCIKNIYHNKEKCEPKIKNQRLQICRECGQKIWLKEKLFCILAIRRAGKTIWKDPLGFAPWMAESLLSLCPLHKW